MQQLRRSSRPRQVAAACASHWDSLLAHLIPDSRIAVFEGERMTPTNERHCVNSASVKFVQGAPPAGFAEAKVL
jgi:peptide methionine sulfoxide reductase MsrB